MGGGIHAMAAEGAFFDSKQKPIGAPIMRKQINDVTTDSQNGVNRDLVDSKRATIWIWALSTQPRNKKTDSGLIH